MERAEITVIGAGVVGLAVARELSGISDNVLVVEKEASWGQGISSRNSEVVHAGIYYPKDSLKARTCIQGRQLLYDFCQKYSVAHRRIGKLIVALDEDEAGDLEALRLNAKSNGVEEVSIVNKDEIKALEPEVNARAALYSPATGIIDSHGLMQKLLMQFQDNGGMVAYQSEVAGIDKVKEGYEVAVKDGNNEMFTFTTRILINSAGLYSDAVASMVGLSKERYRLKYCKGDYLRVNSRKAGLLKRLVYPVLRPAGGGLGIHATLDLAGGLRLGPDDEYVPKIDYTVTMGKVKIFYESVRRFLPFITLEDLSPDMAGIRPKLQGPGEPFRDFVIVHEDAEGYPGFVNLIGIESPGLTSALAIAAIVKNTITKLS